MPLIKNRSRLLRWAAARSTPRKALGAALAVLAIADTNCAHRSVKFASSQPPIIVRAPSLYPETIVVDPQRDAFLVGSFRRGGVFAVARDGSVSRVVDDPRLCSVLGIALDADRGRVWVVNADLGASLRPSSSGMKKLAAVGMYDRATGSALAYVDVSTLLAGPHLLNGIALDRSGNAYVTDSFSPVIYKIDAMGRAIVFTKSDLFRGDGVNLNGLVVHPNGYLLVVKKSDGALFKVPLEQPADVSQVRTDRRFVGGDGLLLLGRDDLVIVANETGGTASNAAFSISSGDDWSTAHTRAVEPLGNGYPTTAVLRDGDIYVLQSQLNELIRATPEEQPRLTASASIRHIGTADR